MPYLAAVIEETLRLYPPVAAGLRRIVPKGGATIDEYFVPENVSLFRLPFDGIKLTS